MNLSNHGYISLFMVFSLGACATAPPGPLAGNSFADVTPHMAQTRPDVVGSRVRWGGVVVSVAPEKNDTCFQMVSHPLDSSARPEIGDQTDGRFIACAPGFFDPAIYEPKREITFVGTIQISTVGTIGDHQYIFPHIAAEEVYLWPKQVAFANYPPGYGYSPFMYSPNPWMMDPMMDPMMGPMMSP